MPGTISLHPDSNIFLYHQERHLKVGSARRSTEQTYPLVSEEQLKAFIAKAKDDQSIQDKLKAAKTPEDVVGIAKEHGHEFTADKITELSEEDLEGVAGGGAFPGASCSVGSFQYLCEP